MTDDRVTKPPFPGKPEAREFAVFMHWSALEPDDWHEFWRRMSNSLPEGMRPDSDAEAFMGWAANKAKANVGLDKAEVRLVDDLLNDRSNLVENIKDACLHGGDPIEVLRDFIRERVL